MRLLFVTIGFFLILTLRLANSVELGDAQRGLTYARQVCAECHAVEVGESLSVNRSAPSFEEVANTPGMTRRALIVWLQTPHPTMPNIIVATDDTDDLIAYILSLRRYQLE